MLTPDIKDGVYRCIKSECLQLKVDVSAIGGTSDHIHLLVRIPASVSVAGLVKQVKGSSSHFVNHAKEQNKEFRWQGAYAAFSISKSLVTIVKAYIQNQERHHSDGTTDKDFEIAWVSPGE